MPATRSLLGTLGLSPAKTLSRGSVPARRAPGAASPSIRRRVTHLADEHELVGADVVGVHHNSLGVLVQVRAQLQGGHAPRVSELGRQGHMRRGVALRSAAVLTLASYFSFFSMRDMAATVGVGCCLRRRDQTLARRTQGGHGWTCLYPTTSSQDSRGEDAPREGREVHCKSQRVIPRTPRQSDVPRLAHGCDVELGRQPPSGVRQPGAAPSQARHVAQPRPALSGGPDAGAAPGTALPRCAAVRRGGPAGGSLAGRRLACPLRCYPPREHPPGPVSGPG